MSVKSLIDRVKNPHVVFGMDKSGASLSVTGEIFRGYFGNMYNPNDNNPPEQDIPESPLDEISEVALVMLKGLNELREKSEEDGFDFLTYLLRMAILEMQEIVSGSNHE